MAGLQTGFRVPPQSTAAIRKLAENTRAALGLPEGRIDTIKLLESLHCYGIVLDVFDAQSAPVGQGVEACWVPESRTLYMHEQVYADAANGGARALFTVSHELGHIMLAHRRTLNREATGSTEIFENSEWQANTFAAEFSMPVSQIQKHDLNTTTRLAAFFGVSRHAARVRLNKLMRDKDLKK